MTTLIADRLRRRIATLGTIISCTDTEAAPERNWRTVHVAAGCSGR